MSGITCSKCKCDINGPITCKQECVCNAHDRKFEGVEVIKFESKKSEYIQ